MKEFGIYLHIPFCQSRCIYCDFYSTTLGEEWQEQYIQALTGELTIRSIKEDFLHARVRTIYIGGGTPSQLQPALLQTLFIYLKNFLKIAGNAEITLEANPDDVTPQWIEALKNTPVNRISMGVQSLDDNVLKFLHRRHNAAQVYRAVKLLREAGYQELSLDLIYGLPGQTLTDFQNDVQSILKLGVPHLSAYALQYEEGTKLWQMRERGEIHEVDEELMLQEYLYLLDATEQVGMEHYEISNFALPGHHSRHNSSYWDGTPYMGLGPGAHSFNGLSMRRENIPDIKGYIEYYNSGEFVDEPCREEILSDKERYDERIMLSLRTAKGLNLNQLERDFGPEMRQHAEQMAQPHLDSGNLKKTGETLRLTRQSLFISDSVIRDLLAD